MNSRDFYIEFVKDQVNGKRYTSWFIIKNNFDKFDLFVSKALKFKNAMSTNRTRNLDDLLSVIIPVIKTKTDIWKYNNINPNNISIKKINFEFLNNNEVKVYCVFIKLLPDNKISHNVNRTLYHMSPVKDLQYLISTYGGLRKNGYFFPTPRIYCTEYPAQKNGQPAIISETKSLLDKLEKQDLSNEENQILLKSINIFCKCIIYEFDYNGIVYEDNENINSKGVYYIENIRRIPVRISELNNQKITYDYLQENYPNIYNNLDKKELTSSKIWKYNKTKLYDFSKLIERLNRIFNFGKNI